MAWFGELGALASVDAGAVAASERGVALGDDLLGAVTVVAEHLPQVARAALLYLAFWR